MEYLCVALQSVNPPDLLEPCSWLAGAFSLVPGVWRCINTFLMRSLCRMSLLANKHVGPKSKPSSASVGTLQVIAELSAYGGGGQCIHSINVHLFTHSFIHSANLC